MIAYSQLEALDQLASCEDIDQLDRLLREARCSVRELRAIRLDDKRDIAPRLRGIMDRVESNPIFRERRASFALEVMAGMFARLA